MSFRTKSKLVFDEPYLKLTEHRVQEFLSNVGGARSIFSSEGLSLLRYSDETEKLASILKSEVSIVVYLRNPEDYLRSHSNQLRKAGFINISDKESHAYMGADSWMQDYELRLRSFIMTFGRDNVHVIDYDEACSRDGNVIPSFLRLLGIENEFNSEDWQNVRLNQS